MRSRVVRGDCARREGRSTKPHHRTQRCKPACGGTIAANRRIPNYCTCASAQKVAIGKHHGIERRGHRTTIGFHTSLGDQERQAGGKGTYQNRSATHALRWFWPTSVQPEAINRTARLDRATVWSTGSGMNWLVDKATLLLAVIACAGTASPQKPLPIRAVDRLRRFIKDRLTCAVKRCIRLESEMRQ